MSANWDVLRMCDMSRIPAVEQMNSELLKAGILKSEVFKGTPSKDLR